MIRKAYTGIWKSSNALDVCVPPVAHAVAEVDDGYIYDCVCDHICKKFAHISGKRSHSIHFLQINAKKEAFLRFLAFICKKV